MGRRRRAARHRRLGHPAPGRHGAADPARPRTDSSSASGTGRARRAGLRWRLLLPPARGRRRVDRRPGTGGGALGPDLGRLPHQRHDRAAAGAARRRQRCAPATPGDAARSVRDPSRTAAWRPAGQSLPVQDRPADHGRPLGADARARRRRDPTRARHSRVDARAARHRHPRRSGQRAGARRLRRRLQGALPVRGVGTLPTWLLRGRARCRPVLHAPAPSTGSGRCRPTPSAAPTGDGRPARRGARRHRPGEPVRRGAVLAGPGRRRRQRRTSARAARPVRWS